MQECEWSVLMWGVSIAQMHVEFWPMRKYCVLRAKSKRIQSVIIPADCKFKGARPCRNA